MATVFLALVAGPGGFKKLMVVKILRDDLMGGSEDAVNMFWSEAKLSAQLVHPNIVHTFEVGEIEGRYFMAMEYLDGQTLRAVQIRAAQHGGLPLNESLRILAEAARGLHYSHGLKSFKGEPLGVVHRDVSPQNLMLTYDGQVKVLDFGIAKMRNSEHLTQAGMIKGKLEYVAPEQLKSSELDGRADVFALGAMLWEAITSERFAGGNKIADVAKVHARLSGAERKLREVKPDVNEELAQIVDRAIAIDPNERFSSAAQLAAAIDAYLAKQPDRPSAESLSAYLEPMFAADRARIQQLVDEQIERSDSGFEPIPQLVADPLSISASGVIANNGPRVFTQDTVVDVEVPAPVPAPKPRSKALWLAGGVLLIVGAGFAWQSSRPADVPVAAGSVTPSAPATAPDTQPSATGSAASNDPLRTASENSPQAVLLEVKVKPAGANVTLDGAALTVPFHGRFQKSDSFHIIEAHADGYRPFKRLVPFNVDQNIAIELEAAPAPQAARRGQRVAANERARAEVTPTADAPVQAPTPQPKEKEPDALEPGKKMTPNAGTGSGIRRRLMVDNPYATQQ